MFISIDGGDGSGKGVQIEFLKEWLNEQGLESVFVRDPGDTPLGDRIRNILLKDPNVEICPKAEAALFMASRAQLVHEKIRPALASGKVVLVDRFLLSTVVYQGFASGASDEEIAELWKIGTVFTQGILPDLTFILDCPVEECNKRLNRAKDRIESKGLEYHARVAEGYRQAAIAWKKNAPGEVFLIDGTPAPEAVFEKIKGILQTRLNRN